MAVRKTNCYEQALACELFDKFSTANSLKEITKYYEGICRVCSLSPTRFPDFYPKIKAKIPSWRANDVWTRLDKRASQPCYARGTVCKDTRVLVIGGGPCGLRTAIEAQLLGAKTVVIEKRAEFARNNVLHLWQFAIADLRNLASKVFYPKFCAGSIDHISIRQLQCILLKIALLVGVEFHCNVSFEGILEPESETDLGWRAGVSPADHPVSNFHFDVVIGADGRRSTLPGFQRKALRAKLAIAITANFIHNHTHAEAIVEEISGVSKIFRPQFFQEMEDAMGIALENIVYYKDETHYFVMTPTKQSLLRKGVLFQDFADPEQLLSPENVDPEALQLFTMQAVIFATDNRLPDLQFAMNSRGEADLALFDFTTMYASNNSCRALERKGHKLLMGLVGDSLLEPFWPTGSGIARGFLAAFDAAWMIRSWGKGLKSVCEVLAERESIHRILAQTTHENLNKDHNQYSIDPTSRYPKINFNSVGARQVKNLFDSDVEVKDVFLSIRETTNLRRPFSEPAEILSWFQGELYPLGISVKSLDDIFAEGQALLAIIGRYRPDLVELNQCALEILKEEYGINMPLLSNDQKSVGETDSSTPQLVQYLSQVYNLFKGEIPKLGTQSNPEELQHRPPSYPNNTALHRSLSIQQFLEAKEKLQQRKAEEEARTKEERRRSRLIESIIQTEDNCNQRRSTSFVNIPVVKEQQVLNPRELFSVCRNGSDREQNRKPDALKLARSRSDVFRLRQSSQTQAKTLASFPSSEPTELEDMQQRIRKSKANSLAVSPIISTFLGKHINQNSGCLSNEGSDENPLSSQQKLLRPTTRPKSTYQNLNNGAESYYTSGDQENVEHGFPSNPFFNRPQRDSTEFRERCNFLEKNLYNSGRDIKVHIGAAYFQKKEEEDSKKLNPSVQKTLKKSQSSAPATGFHPLKRGGSSFNVRSEMEESFNNTRGGDGHKAGEEFNPDRAVFLKERLAKLANRHPELRSGEKSPSPNPRNDHDSYQVHPPKGTPVPPFNSNPKRAQNKAQKGKNFTESSSPAVDSDLDCFLNAIDFNAIDGQDLQELLSSY